LPTTPDSCVFSMPASSVSSATLAVVQTHTLHGRIAEVGRDLARPRGRARGCSALDVAVRIVLVACAIVNIEGCGRCRQPMCPCCYAWAASHVLFCAPTVSSCPYLPEPNAVSSHRGTGLVVLVGRGVEIVVADLDACQMACVYASGSHTLSSCAACSGVSPPPMKLSKRLTFSSDAMAVVDQQRCSREVRGVTTAERRGCGSCGTFVL
jgi:hypothetical protein